VKNRFQRDPLSMQVVYDAENPPMNTPRRRPFCVSSLRLTAEPIAVGLSRAFIRQTLRGWQLTDHIEVAELVVSELVTNAVKSSGVTTPDPKMRSITAQHIIGVQLRLVGASLYVEVWDRGDGSPVLPQQSPDAEGGRGLFLVESVSRRWGVHRPAVGGKTVWAELSLTAPVNPPLQGEGLPRRDPGTHGPVAGEELEQVDIALMQRVLDGLRSAHRRGMEALAMIGRGTLLSPRGGEPRRTVKT
jgi:anti-sigma regulatory factor (Ser/Thr protein kinase)